MSLRSVLQVAWLALALPYAASNAAAAPAADRDFSGLRLHLDNDLFAGKETDRDYTGGLAVTISGDAARDNWLSLDPLLQQIDSLSSSAPADTYYAQQVGLMAFTPGDTLTSAPVYDDRPYASLLFASNARVRVDAPNTAWSSSLTVGVLGLSLSEQIHNVVHDVVGSERPRGYEHQISAGGELTARYSLARHHLWIANPNGTLDVKTTVQGSVGYLTETSASISMRIGRFRTPWWSFAPELTDYIAAPLVTDAAGRGSEMYAFAGARVKARAYNVFLQGQFRHSEVRYTFDEVEPLVAEAWLGVVVPLFGRTQMSYTINYQTAEIREGEAAGDSLWGAVQLVHTF